MISGLALKTQSLSMLRRLSIVGLALGVALGGFFCGAVVLNHFFGLELSIHSYYPKRAEFAVALSESTENSEPTVSAPWLYGEPELSAHFDRDQKNAAKFAAWDLLFPFLYGLTALAAYRIVLLGIPSNLFWRRFEKFLIMWPLPIGILADFSENILILFLYQGWQTGEGESMPAATIAIAALATLIKTIAVAWVYLGIALLSLWVLLRGRTV